MSRKAWTKFAMFILALLTLVPVALIALSLLTRFISAFHEGADPASIFHGHQLLIPSQEMAQWLPFTDETEKPTRAEQEEIVAAYVEAWDALDRAYQTGDITDLATYWAGEAYKQAVSAVDLKPDLVQTHRDHRLLLTFMSSDGSVITFHDQAFTLEQTLDRSVMTLQADATVVMTLDQGFWRIRSLQLEFHETILP